MDTILTKIVTALEGLSQRVKGFGTTDNLNTSHGWHHVALSMDDLSARAERLAARIKSIGDRELDADLQRRLAKFPEKINALASNTAQYLNNGNGHHGVAAYLGTLETLESFLSPLWDWYVVDDPKAMPSSLGKRVRSYRAELDSLSVEIPELRNRVKLINDAHEAAQALPVDMAELKEARDKIRDALNDIEEAKEAAAARLQSISDKAAALEKVSTRAAGVLAEVEDTYRITTAKGLAASFYQAAERLKQSIWFWVLCLVIALGAVAVVALQRVETLNTLLTGGELSWGKIWMNFTLSAISLAAPVWFAWMATKQIGQRFRLAEDYAYKAAVAQAYEGFRREAAKFSPEFAERLLASALARLDEPPLRWVEADTHGSPWHELIESDAFKKALAVVPELRGVYDQAKRKRQEKAAARAKKSVEATEPAKA